MTLISAIIGIVCSLIITIANDLCAHVYDLWIPILLFLGFTIAGMLLMIVVIFIITLFVDMKKPVDKPSKFWFALYNFVNDYLVFWSGANVKICENEKLGKGPYLFVINHRSNFDTMIMSKYYKKHKILMVSKPGNFKIPIAGPAIKKSGFLSMPRDDARASLKVVLKSADYLKEENYSIGICPEGTRNKSGEGLLPFKNGCFKIAIKANVPIAVFCVSGTQKIHKNFPLKRTNVYFNLLKVITPEEYKGKSTTEIGNMVRDLMYDDLEKYEPTTRRIEDESPTKSVA